MAHSLHRIEGSLIGGVMLKQGHSPDNRLTYEQGANAIIVREKGFPDTVTLGWAFGSGAQGSTAVGLLDGQYIEHRFSYYSRIQGLAPTFGHPAHVSSPIAEIGVLQDSRTIFQCFNCHGTDAELGPSGPVLTRYMPGVQCERCHGPGSGHINAAKAGASMEAIRKEIVNPGRFRAEALIQFCGQCHRLPTPDMGSEPELENPVTVRFAPIGLLASRCFRISRAISCLTCHNPHENPRPRTDMSYSRTCLACHADDRTPEKLCRRDEKQNCLPCHMKQASLGPYLRFTDHRIRVYQ
ncbi:MAG: cytochrome c3 family protein [Bryobacteraceae bacterium]